MIALEDDLPLFIQKGASQIELINLAMQSEPYTGRSPQVQLELRVREGDREERFFIWHWKDGESGTDNYPRAFGSHIFSLVESRGHWFLLMEEASFSKVFYLALGHSVLWDALELSFVSSLSESAVDPEGNYEGSLIRSELRLTAGEVSKTIFAESGDKEICHVFEIDDREYILQVLEMGEDDLKLEMSGQNK